ncbi:MAG: GntR family transcriptional regulator [Alphaproteobacteria bacterium]|nr:GntR family transcriptional regulator [Alphaproteobacteria bacterium]MBM3732707.1 GntR family transcriptional regulator [Acidimicrobiia bacterium]
MNRVIARERVFSQVHRYLRDKILRGEYPRGARLIETDIAAELSVSRTPVREALVLLQGQDLVSAIENGGYIVADPRQQLTEILDIRIALETHAVTKAIERFDGDDLRRLENICDNMEALRVEDVAPRAELNRRFHETLVGAAHNRRLAKMVVDYQDYFHVIQPLYDSDAIDKTQAEHRAIVDALRRRDVSAATRLVTEHITDAGELIAKKFEQPPRTVSTTT